MINLHQEFRKSQETKERESYKGLDGFVHTAIGYFYKQLLMPRGLRKQAQRIYELSQTLEELSDEALDRSLEHYRKIIRFNKASKREIYEAIAYVNEASFRELGIRAYDVQIMGVLAQERSFAIEMLPGEGKTVTAALWGVIAAWSGEPCHIVTSNDYLASRDAKEMEPLYRRCSLKVASVVSSLNEDQRRESYRANILYATSKELLADFLRDAMKDSVSSFDGYLIERLSSKNISTQKVMQGLHTAIVDEADSVLADEAITPLIISVSVENEILNEATLLAKEIAQKLLIEEDYSVDKTIRQILFTQQGEEIITAKKDRFPPIWREKNRREFLIKQALIASYFYQNNIDYIINAEGEIVIVDEKTGRVMEGHSWGAGLQQAVEAKEGVEISAPTQTQMKMSFQRFFRLYKRVSGMSGTLQNLQNELWYIYKLPTIKVPKRVANTYILKEVQIYQTKKEKFEAIIEDIKRVHRSMRPILVGMKDIKESEELASLLLTQGVESTVLNALKHEEEEEIVNEAGRVGKITIATNMAGRGTDIKIDETIDSMGGLHVIATQKFSSHRVDLQLYGRTARQGQNGTVQQIFSFEDELFEKVSKSRIMRFFVEHSENRLSKKTFMLLYHLIQLGVEKQATRLRKRILKKDFQTNEMLSFSANER